MGVDCGSCRQVGQPLLGTTVVRCSGTRTPEKYEHFAADRRPQRLPLDT
ncbi:zinc finger domain-containing protein [Desulforamulus reducens]|nr:hypothetical protein [Desulforamulus reducens]